MWGTSLGNDLLTRLVVINFYFASLTYKDFGFLFKWRTGVNVLRRNSVRLAEVWLDDYKEYYYQRIGNEKGDFGDVSGRLELR